MATRKKVKPPPVVQQPVASKKRGRPKGSTNKPKTPSAVRVGGGIRVDVPINEINLEDTTFKFRVKMRVGDIIESIKKEGQQFPVLLRRYQGSSKHKYQLISGFRRITAIKTIGGDMVSAVVRDDLSDNEQAFRVSVIENEIRKTYNDLDRAYAMLAYREMGKRPAEIEELFQVGARQRQRLEELTTFPKELQAAIADERVSSTNAVRLMQHVRKHPGTDIKKWIRWIAENDASYEELGKALKADVAQDKSERSIDFFVEQEKKGVKSLRVRPISIGSYLSREQRRALADDLKKVLKFVEGLE